SKFYSLFDSLPGERQIIVLNIDSAQTSCGYGVPIFEFKEERETLREWANKKGEQGIFDYWREKNQTSIDGLPTRILENH
ncbi:MAG: pyridoxamine 5'-phosphate oxidase family protein, partial [Phormidium sp.]